MRREWLAAINGIHHPDAVLLHGAGFAGRISLLLDDRITHAGTLSGEWVLSKVEADGTSRIATS
jgi:hypothetical protein